MLVATALLCFALPATPSRVPGTPWPPPSDRSLVTLACNSPSYKTPAGPLRSMILFFVIYPPVQSVLLQLLIPLAASPLYRL